MIRSLLFLVLLALSFTSDAQVIISELKLDSGWVELHNTADTAVDVSSWWLCDRPAYALISGVTLVSGSTNIPSGGYVVLGWGPISASAGELGLYVSSSFGSASAIRDYVRYGGLSTPTRASVAVNAGVWSATTDFVPFPLVSTHSLENVNFQAASGDDTNLSTWAEGFNTLGASNHDNVIINEINLDGNWVELKNTANAPIDISNWWLCDRPAYSLVSSLVVLSGSTTIPGDSFVVVQWAPISAAVGELGLYINSSFGSSNAVRDYTQYGGITSPTRAPVAVAAGVWGATTEFISFPAVDTNSLENTLHTAKSGIETRLADWAEDVPTLGTDNNDSVCPPEYTIANGNALTGTESGTVTYATDGAIESDQTIAATGIVEYDSGLLIDLLPNFEVVLGGEFSAIIDGCD